MRKRRRGWVFFSPSILFGRDCKYAEDKWIVVWEWGGCVDTFPERNPLLDAWEASVAQIGTLLERRSPDDVKNFLLCSFQKLCSHVKSGTYEFVLPNVKVKQILFEFSLRDFFFLIDWMWRLPRLYKATSRD